MRFLLDGGVPRSIQDFLVGEGLETLRLAQTKLFAAADKEVFSFAQREGYILITRDKGFGDIRSYPPGNHHGIILIRDPNLDARKITKIFEEAWAVIPHEELQGSIVIITQRGVRIRKP
jgi:predicted nuclease of predicted toxin-antitoxin system